MRLWAYLPIDAYKVTLIYRRAKIAILLWRDNTEYIFRPGKRRKMKKIALALGLMALAGLAQAADPLNGTTWKTIDDKTKKAKALVKFTEQKNGTLTASIQQILTPGEENACSKCEGPYKGKSLKGLTIVHGLKNTGGASYEGGTILDPNSGKTYKLKGTLAKDAKTLDLRGYMGVSALGRNQTWVRAD